MLYYEKQGLFYGDYAHGGIFYEKVYKLENHLLSTVAERAVKGDETNPDYFVNEKTATKEEYDASLQNVFDMDNAKTLDSYHSKEDILKTINDYESVDDTTKKITDIKDGLTASVTCDKDNYKADENVNLTFKVTNTNDFAVKNVSLKAVIPNNFQIKDNAKTQKDTASLKKGENLTLSLTATTKIPSAQTTETQSENASVSSSQPTGKNPVLTGKLPILLTMIAILIIILILLIVLLFKERKKLRMFSFILCVLIIGNCATAINTAVSATNSSKNFEVKRTLKIDGKNYEVKAVVNYEIPENNNTDSRDNTADRYNAYLKKVNELQNRYGEGHIANEYLTYGLSVVRLLDFDGDGKEELLCAYGDKADTTSHRGLKQIVYSYENGQVNEIFNDTASAETADGISFAFVTYMEKEGKLYLEHFYCVGSGRTDKKDNFYTLENGQFKSALNSNYFSDGSYISYELNGKTVGKSEYDTAISNMNSDANKYFLGLDSIPYSPDGSEPKYFAEHFADKVYTVQEVLDETKNVIQKLKEYSSTTKPAPNTTSYTAMDLMNKNVSEIVNIMGGEFELEFSSDRTIYNTGETLYFYNDNTLPGFTFWIDNAGEDYLDLRKNTTSEKALKVIKDNIKNGKYKNFAYMALYDNAKANNKISADMSYTEISQAMNDYDCIMTARAGDIIQSYSDDTAKITVHYAYNYSTEFSKYQPGEHISPDIMKRINPPVKGIVVFPNKSDTATQPPATQPPATQPPATQPIMPTPTQPKETPTVAKQDNAVINTVLSNRTLWNNYGTSEVAFVDVDFDGNSEFVNFNEAVFSVIDTTTKTLSGYDMASSGTLTNMNVYKTSDGERFFLIDVHSQTDAESNNHYTYLLKKINGKIEKLYVYAYSVNDLTGETIYRINNNTAFENSGITNVSKSAFDKFVDDFNNKYTRLSFSYDSVTIASSSSDKDVYAILETIL